MAKRKSCKYSPRICHHFPKNFFSRNLSKIIFPSFSVDSQIFRNLSKNSPSISWKLFSRGFPKTYSWVFITIWISSRILRQILFIVCFQLVDLLNPSGRMALPCPMISQSHCKKRGRMSRHMILFVSYSFSGRSLMCVMEYFSITLGLCITCSALKQPQDNQGKRMFMSV